MEFDTALPFLDASENQAWRSMRGFVSVDGAKALYRYPFDSDPQGVAVEIGSLSGRSTVCIGRALRDSNRDSRLTAIDIRFQPDFTRKLERFGLSDHVEAIQRPSVNAAEGWRDKISFIYIDGAHGRALAYADFLVWEMSLMVGGVIALDDTYGFFTGSTLQLQAAVRSGAYEPLGFIGGITFLRKKGPILAGIGEYPMQIGSLIAYVDYVGSWIGAMDLEMRLPRHGVVRPDDGAPESQISHRSDPGHQPKVRRPMAGRENFRQCAGATEHRPQTPIPRQLLVRGRPDAGMARTDARPRPGGPRDHRLSVHASSSRCSA